MPIYLTDSSPLPAFFGKVSSTMGAFTADFDGSTTPQPDIDGSLNRAMDSFTASFGDGFLFPRVGADLIGNRRHAWHAPPGPDLRANAKLVDYLNSGLPANGGWDNNNSTFLTRQEYEDELLAPDTNLQYMTYYSDVMESGNGGVHSSKIYNTNGPPGAQNFWVTHNTGDAQGGIDQPGGSDVVPTGPYASTGLPVNDWWGRRASGQKKGTFDPSYNVNITDWTSTDGQGRRYPQYYADYELAEKFYTTTKKDGSVKSVGAYSDVVDFRTKTSNIDWNGDGIEEDGQDGWNDGTINQTAAEKWRAGHAAYLDRLDNTYSGMIMTPNGTTWSRNVSSTDMSQFPYVYDEYFQKWHGAATQNHMKISGFPLSGVLSDGTNGGDGSWQRSYNCIVNAVLSTKWPNLCNADWAVDLNDDYNPTASGSVMSNARWGFATVLLHNAVFTLNRSGGGNNYRTVPLMDETGLINTSTTGLSQHWLQRAEDDPQLTPVQSTNIWARKFGGGAVIVNTDRTGSATTVDVDLVLGGGSLYRRIDGFQDPTFNDGSTVTGNFSLAIKDAVFLVKL